jgi:hypothetical protein
VPDLLRLIWARADALQPLFTWDEVSAWPAGALAHLLALGLLRPGANAASVVCDACGEGHVGEVLFLDTPGGEPRAYVHCPEAGRARVPLERLRRWEVHFPGLATAVAAALGTAGEVEEILPGRIWLLGRIALDGRPREVFLARGLLWPDAAEAVGKATRLLASSRPVVLVGGDLPPAQIWRGDPPRILPLSALLCGDGEKLTADVTVLAATSGKSRARASAAPCSFPTPVGATWEDVRLKVGEHRIHLDVRGRRKTFTFQEAGFVDRRKGNAPDRLWRLLRVFALHGGVIPVSGRGLDRRVHDNLKQNVNRLGHQLRALLLIDGSPFKDSRRSRRYETRFKITAEEGVRFPTPVGITWDNVALTEVRPGVIVVSVETAETFAAYSLPDEEGGGRGRWEAAQRPGELAREYELHTLGLADDDSQPDAQGEALIAVLRAGGKVQRPPTDRAMLTLGKRLCHLMQLQDSPFQFSRERQTWSALFDASSSVADASR